MRSAGWRRELRDLSLSGCRESNPDLTLPKRVYYHYTTPRVDLWGIEPQPRPCHGRIRPLNYRPLMSLTKLTLARIHDLYQMFNEFMRVTADGAQRFGHERLLRQARQRIGLQNIDPTARIDDEIGTGIMPQAESSMGFPGKDGQFLFHFRGKRGRHDLFRLPFIFGLDDQRIPYEVVSR